MPVFRLFVLCLLCCGGALAQVAVAPYGGYAFEQGPFAGAGLDVPFLRAASVTLSVRPAVDYLFLDAADTALYDATASGFLVGAEGLGRFGAEGLRPFVGVGVALYYATTSFDCGGDAACDAFQGSFEGANDGLWVGPSASAGLLLPDIELNGTAVGAPFAQLRLALVGELLLSALGGVVVPLDLF